MARYSKEFKAEALKLSDELGVKKAAAQVRASVLYAGGLEKQPQARRAGAKQSRVENTKPRVGTRKRRVASR